MSSVSIVPETECLSGDELSADDAWHTVRRYGVGHLLSTGFLRFRYGDGFSHARALLMPIRWPEPFGMVMIEALVCGTPVIAFPEGSAPELGKVEDPYIKEYIS